MHGNMLITQSKTSQSHAKNLWCWHWFWTGSNIFSPLGELMQLT